MISISIDKIQTLNMWSADYISVHETGRDGEVPA